MCPSTRWRKKGRKKPERHRLRRVRLARARVQVCTAHLAASTGKKRQPGAALMVADTLTPCPEEALGVRLLQAGRTWHLLAEPPAPGGGSMRHTTAPPSPRPMRRKEKYCKHRKTAGHGGGVLVIPAVGEAEAEGLYAGVPPGKIKETPPQIKYKKDWGYSSVVEHLWVQSPAPK